MSVSVRLSPRALAPVVVFFLISCGPEPRMGTDGIADLEQALSVCQGPSTVPGIDISHWDGTINWPKVADAGYRWAYAKATEGTTYIDPTFTTNWAGAQSAGVLRGPYHFFHPETDGKAQ